MNSAAIVPGEPQNVEGSVSADRSLSALQREFALAFVANGGKAREAALAAGYSEASAANSATKNLANPKVGAEITRLCRTFVHAGLPAAIHRLISIITNPDAKPRDTLKAIEMLLERAGMATEKGGVQVNVGVQVNGQQAQALIGEVWNAKQARLSDIPPAMPDTLDALEEDVQRLAIEPPATQAGGDHLQGPAAGTCPLPVPSSEHSPETDDFQPAPSEAFKRAFDDDTHSQGDE